MAKEIKKDAAQEAVEQVSKTDLFFQKYTKVIIICVTAVIIVALAAFLYSRYIYAPAKAEALGQMFPAEELFAQQDYQTALEGDGNILGFAQIAKEYGAKAGKAVFMYAGVCELQLGNYEEAVKYLDRYHGKDKILAGRALACKGDALSALERYDQALSCYLKAAKKSGNLYSAAYLLKAGVVAEELEKNDVALDCYNTIKEEYPMSAEAMDIEKYITRIGNK